MHVLNTIHGDPTFYSTWYGWVAVALFIIGLVTCGVSVEGGSPKFLIAGAVIFIVSMILLFTVPLKLPTGQHEPDKLEVKITDPHYVIDATKYKVLSKRGEIVTLEVLNN